MYKSVRMEIFWPEKKEKNGAVHRAGIKRNKYKRKWNEF